MSENRYLTRREAAAASGCHPDTIRRAEAAGRLPNRRTRSDGSIEIPVSDLVAAGLLDPVAAGDGLPELVARTRTERDLLEARQQVALEQARVAGLDTLLDRAHEEITFLRSLVRQQKAA